MRAKKLEPALENPTRSRRLRGAPMARACSTDHLSQTTSSSGNIVVSGSRCTIAPTRLGHQTQLFELTTLLCRTILRNTVDVSICYNMELRALQMSRAVCATK